MKKGIGCDILEISRIEKILKEQDKFITRIFSLREQEMLKKKKFAPQSVAVNFAAKEAFIKATGESVAMNEIEVLRDLNDKPFIVCKPLSGKLECEVSLSHSDLLAMAVVYVEAHS